MDRFELEQKLQRSNKEHPASVPQIVRNRQEAVYASLDGISVEPDQNMRWDQKRNGRRLRRTWIAGSVAAAVLGFIGSGFISPVMAESLREIPLVGSLYQFTDDLGFRTAEKRGLTSIVGAQQTHEGIRLSIPGVVYDGTRLSFELKRDGEGLRSGLSGFSRDGKVYKGEEKGTVKGVEISINGQPLGPYHVMFKPQEDPDTELFTITDRTFIDENSPMLPEQFDMHAKFTLEGVNSPYELDIPIRKSKENPRILTPNLNKKADGIDIALKKAQLTSLSTRLQFIIKGTGEDQQLLSYDIVDDKGKKLGLIMGASESRDGNTIVDYVVDPADLNASSIIIKPYFPVFKNEAAKTGEFQLDKEGNLVKREVAGLEMTVPINR
ncbi:DUF4179 domain-containing protein [Paenibacillus sp.]|jgi:hypothetical protein|uniref:DUF4179 domain-containing protein n=1 Tax=Paenibacillus sp. TaxID=58172 RepID=UPI002836B74C|nr:DUF4179 domain-containing protein [Paenibacillus sp.]MDR0267313.1 DUF4179 domain-containing protein [Paenibacillus sp.]